jgi:toxin YoeB
MKRIAFEAGAFADFVQWATDDKKLYQRIVSLLQDTVRQP